MLFDLISGKKKISDFFEMKKSKTTSNACACGSNSEESCSSKNPDGYEMIMDKKMDRRKAFSSLTKDY